MKRASLACWVICAAVGLSDWGQVSAQIAPNVKAEMEASLPGARFYESGGITQGMYGTVLATGNSPLESAQAYLARWDAMFGSEIGVLIPKTIDAGGTLQGVMLNRATGQYKFYTFRFEQYFQELPVFRSGVGFLVRNEPNFPVVMTGFNVKNLAGLDSSLIASAEPVVTPGMLESVGRHLDGDEDAKLHRELLGIELPQQIQTSEERLVIWAGVDGWVAEPQVAVAFIAQRGSVRTLPHYQRELIIASLATQEVLYSENQIVHLDINGTVSGRETSGIRAAECDPEATAGLPYAQAQVIGGNTVFANSQGQFTIPHAGTTSVTVRSSLRGQYFEVRDQSAGAAIPFIDQVVTPPGPANFLHNPTANQQLPTGNVNAYLDANVVRDYVLDYEPTFPIIFNQTFFDVNTNIASSCNAYYDGVSINFYQSGGGCNNTAFSDVVYHEYGHHLVDVTDNGQGQFGEGAGDVMGVLIQDEPILGHGFVAGSCGSGIRTAANNLQYPQTGEIHEAGQLISACVWDTRNQLLVTEPSSYRDISASLFLGMMIVRGMLQPGYQTIDPQITVYYLQLDDDDANLGNGTPHYQEIAAGFGLHNMDAPPLDLVDFNYSTQPELISPAGGVAFTVTVVPVSGTPQPGTGVLHVDRGSGFEAFPMNQTSPNVYQANFPASSCGTILRYYVAVQTTDGQTQQDPEGAPTAAYQAISADFQQTVFTDNFQTNKGWTVTTTATDGPWERAVPAGGGDRGDPPTDADGSGMCFVTDNADGNSDVDGGSTTLTSPSFNGTTTGQAALIVSYWRWYSNVVGGSPEQDTFVVQVSNNNGANWTNLEVVGPAGPEVQGGWIRKVARINMIATSSQMRIRFTASDVDPGSVVEAGVDGVEIKVVNCYTTADVVATQLNVVTGANTGGTLADADTSNNVYLSYRPTTVQFQGLTIKLDFESTVPVNNPLELRMILEANINQTGTIHQKIEMFNFITGQFELVHQQNATTNNDSVVNVLPTGNLARFIEPTSRLVRTRVSYIPSRTRFTGRANLDQLIWRIKY